MRRTIVLFFLFSLFVLSSALAQVAEIIDIKGNVRIREPGKIFWRKAKIHMLLKRDTKLETGARSECTLTFDEDLMNIVTIKANSLITIEEVKPGRIFLPQGRVFSLIDQLSSVEEFQIRTPTAIAGARGTGWSTDSSDRGTDVKCYEDRTFVQGLDDKGNVTGEKDLDSGFGLDVGPGGDIGNPFDLGPDDFDEWRDFKDNAEDKRGGSQGRDNGPQGEGGFDNLGGGSSLNELREERRDDIKEDLYEDFRREWDNSRSGQDITES
jgi:hypothetical protein